MNKNIKLLDIVALRENMPEYDLYRGQVGTVVEILAPQIFEVDFSDDEGQSYAMLALKAEQLLVLHYNKLDEAA
jgi:hypothetical protein